MPGILTVDDRNALVVADYDREEKGLAKSIARQHRGLAARLRIELDDVVQDAFLGLITGLDEWDPVEHPDTDRDHFLRERVQWHVNRGLRHGHDPDVLTLTVEDTGRLGDTTWRPCDPVERVHMVKRNGRVVWVVGVTERPKQKRKRKAQPTDAPSR